MSAIALTNVTKKFDNFAAIENLNLTIEDGEFFTMLGPSGSGKTTTLRMIAGFEQPTSGTISFQGRDVTNAPPFDRDVNTVFQDYALFPHMSCLDNVAYGLRVQGVPKKDRYERAHQALQLVQLDAKAGNKPSQLSGGQRQRVALARAIVLHPKVLLLDEPLGALDLKLRQEMQVELKQLQRELGITFVFVTHDQEEAMVMSDRIAVFNQGHIEQLDTPDEIYNHPANEFVAGFVGTTNFIPEHVNKDAGIGAERYAIRPEHIVIHPSGSGNETVGTVIVAGHVIDSTYLGTGYRIIVKLDDGSLFTVQRPADDQVPGNGAHVDLQWRAADQIKLADTPVPPKPSEQS